MQTERRLAASGQPAPAEPSPGRGRLQVLAVAPTSFFGDYGCHVRILEEVLALSERNVRIAVTTYPFGRQMDEVPIYRAPRLPGQRRVEPGSSIQKFSLDGVLLLQALRAAALERPGIVHGHLHEGALIGWLVARAFRIPLLFDFQGSLTSEMLDHNFLAQGSAAYAAFRRVEEWIVKRPDAIVTSTQGGADLLVKEFGCEPGRVTVVPDAVDVRRFRPLWEIAREDGYLARLKQLRRSLGIPEDRSVVVYLGLLAEYQGITQLLYAARRLIARGVNAHFLIMGFPGELTYQRVAKYLGLEEHVTFTGAIPYEAAPSYLALGDVAVSPKVSETEGNGKVLNYMALGLPTVAFASRASREILGDLGIYAEPGDWKDLAAKLEDALSDPADALERGHALREQAVNQHSWTQSAQILLDTYTRLTAW